MLIVQFIDNLIQFMDNWQNLIGAMIGAFIAIIGSVYINLYIRNTEKIQERKRQYADLLSVLHDLQLFITRCEAYLNFGNQNKVSFNKIVINPTMNYIESSQSFELNPEVYNSILKIYNIANVIKYNIDKSEVIRTDEKKINKNETEHIQESIICKRYQNALAFIKHYLEDIYRNFNFIALQIKKLSEKYKYLNFSKSIKFYDKEYVKDKIQKYKLELGKLDGY